MAWTPVSEFKNGDTVTTTQGDGVVVTQSEAQGTVRIRTEGGGLIEVPKDEVRKITILPEGIFRKEETVFKPGDKVKSKRTGKEGTVTEVTQRTVRVSGFGRGGATSIPKRVAGQQLEKVGSGEAGTPTENLADLKVGDRVRATGDNGLDGLEGQAGTVRSVAGGSVGVEFDNDVSGHDLDGKARDGHGWWVGTDQLEKFEDKAEEAEAEAEAVDKVKQTGDNLFDLSNLQAYLEKKVDSSVDAELKELRDLAKQNQKLEIKVGDETHMLKGKKHNQLETLITYAGLRMASLLVGMAGTGKTHAGEQVAEALGLKFYAMSVGAQTSKSDIIGYMDASGNYVKTFFRDAYEKGGVFLMDEIDAGNANVLIQVNAALSNGLCAFPDAMVKQHEDFVFIASANTYGNGANRQYVGRNQLDAATLDRFAVIDWRIDDELESQLAVGKYGAAWYKAVRAARQFVADKNIRALISPRATQKGSKLLAAGVNVDEVISSVLLSSVPDDKRADVIQVAVTVYEKEASGVPSTVVEEIAASKLAEMPF